MKVLETFNRRVFYAVGWVRNGTLPVVFCVIASLVLTDCTKTLAGPFDGCVEISDEKLLSELSIHIAAALGRNSMGVDGYEALEIVNQKSDLLALDCPDRYEVYTNPRVRMH